MITKNQIKQVINNAESELKECWTFLAAMKKGKLQQTRHISLIQFQPKLAKTIFDLTQSYREIEQEKNHHINNKRAYSAKWFGTRMQFLSNQQKILNQAIAIGKGVGDAFAWVFYQNDRQYLAEHLTQQTQLHAPPGIGGLGELEFIKQVPLVYKHFVLYHGNTNILRLGDFTLIDLKNFRVVGIGELKSQSLKPGELEMSLIVSGPIAHKMTRVSNPPARGKPVDIVKKLSPSGQARLKRQTQTLLNSYKKLGATPDKKLNVEIVDQCHALTGFIASLKTNQFSYKQFGKSLLLVGCKTTKKTLYQKLSDTESLSYKSKLEGVQDHALGLVANNRDDNAIIVGTFYYDDDGKTHLIPGMSHLVWWPLSHEAIKSILFQDVIIITIFNPAHLIASLEKAGFSVEETGRFNYKVSKKRDGHQCIVEGMNYYLKMIQEYLFTEDTIILILNKAEGQLGNLNAKGPQRMELLIEQTFVNEIETSKPKRS